MTAVRSQQVTITLDDAREVSGLLQTPPGAGVCYVLAHAAGAGMSHPFMADIANGLAERRIATLRYQFPYMEWSWETGMDPFDRIGACDTLDAIRRRSGLVKVRCSLPVGLIVN